MIWQGLRPVVFGLASGLLAALAVGRLVRSLLFGVSATDQWTLGIITAVLASVAVMACLLPAHGVSRIDPAGVLREE